MFYYLLFISLTQFAIEPSATTVASEAYAAEIDYTEALSATAYVYLNPGEEATAHVENPDDFFWYGAHDGAAGPALILVDWTAYYTNDPEIGLLPRLEPTQDRIRLLIGSSERLSTGSIKGQFYEGYDSSFGHAPALNTPLLQSAGMALLGTGLNAELWISTAGQIQLLNANGEGYPSHLVFRGDLDADGATDYIVSYGEHVGNEVLYLSSAASDEQLVAPVAACTYTYWE